MLFLQELLAPLAALLRRLVLRFLRRLRGFSPPGAAGSRAIPRRPIRCCPAVARPLLASALFTATLQQRGFWLNSLGVAIVALARVSSTA